MPGKGRPPRARTDPAAENRQRGLAIIEQHPLFAPLAYRADFPAVVDDDRCPPGGWAVVTSLDGSIVCRMRTVFMRSAAILAKSRLIWATSPTLPARRILPECP